MFVKQKEETLEQKRPPSILLAHDIPFRMVGLLEPVLSSKGRVNWRVSPVCHRALKKTVHFSVITEM